LREEHRLRVSESTVPRKTPGPNRDEVTGECGRLRNEKCRDIYASANIIRVFKSRIKRGVGRVVRLGKRIGAYRIFVENLTQRGHMETKVYIGE
jgi:hypothetical protein